MLLQIVSELGHTDNTIHLCIPLLINLIVLFSFAGVDWFLATVMAVAICLLFAVNTYIVVLWVDPSDQSASLWQLVGANGARLKFDSFEKGDFTTLTRDVVSQSNVLSFSAVYFTFISCFSLSLLLISSDACAEKVLIVTALSLAGGAILGLPLDVANNSNSLECGDGSATTSSGLDCGNLDMTLFWEILMVCVFVFVVVLLPMAIFQYESYDEVEVRGKRTTSNQACLSACYWEVLLLIATFLTLGLMYAFLGTAEVPVMAYQMDLAPAVSDDVTDDKAIAAYASVWDNSQEVFSADLSTTAGLAAFTSGGAIAQSSTSCVGSDCYAKDDSALLEIRTTFAVYIIALTGWIGWFFFVVFGGIGLASLPASLLRGYTNRPVIMSSDQLAAAHTRLQARTNELLKLGLELKKSRDDWNQSAKNSAGWRARSARKTSDRNHVNKFKQMVFVLEEEYDTWRICKGNSKEYNPLTPYFSLLLGMLASLLSLLWILHIVLYVLVDPPVDLFLNAYFIQFDAWFPLFGVASVCLFAGYLLACVMSGIFKVGLRCFCVTLHPMRFGKTMMNSFMFNTMWILLCAIPVVQFCTEAFDSYARYTSIATLLGVQVKYLKFLRLFFKDNIFVYCFLAVFALSLIGLSFKPKDKAADAKKLKHAIRAKR